MEFQVTPVSEQSIETLLQGSKVALFQDPTRTCAGDHFDQTLSLSSFLHVTFPVHLTFLQGNFRHQELLTLVPFSVWIVFPESVLTSQFYSFQVKSRANLWRPD